MSEALHRFSTGDRVRVLQCCFDATLWGAVGVVAPKLKASVNAPNQQIVWIEFDPVILTADGIKIEASEIDVADLEPA
ncbi:MAG TPA: hypothetical protein VGP76_04005 [Planctomycetaceae bacterium]|jgi:hypothetical protein|nr:hypothetical protein [Planctomycetaceae bacterium]